MSEHSVRFFALHLDEIFTKWNSHYVKNNHFNSKNKWCKCALSRSLSLSLFVFIEMATFNAAHNSFIHPKQFNCMYLHSLNAVATSVLSKSTMHNWISILYRFFFQLLIFDIKCRLENVLVHLVACSLPAAEHFVFLSNYERNRCCCCCLFPLLFRVFLFGDGKSQLHGYYYLRGARKRNNAFNEATATTSSLFLHLVVITRLI